MSEPNVLPPMHSLVIDNALDAGINPALALAVAHQESGGLNPSARNPQGEGYGAGLFGFIPSTAKMLGMPWDQRFDPTVSSQYGTRYLKQLLDSNGGDVTQALRQYGGADAPKGDPNYDTHVLAHYPQYAQYETLQRGRPPGQPGATPNGAVDLDAIDAGLRQEWQGAGAKTGASQGNVDLDAIDNQLKQEWQGTAGSQPAPNGPSVPSDLTITIEKPSTGNVPEGLRPVDVGKELGISTQSLPDFLREGAAVGVQGAATLGGAALGTLTGPAAPVVAPITAALGSYAGHTLNKWLGFAPGTPTVLPQTFDDYLSLAVPMAAEAIPAAQTALRYSRAGRAITAAEGETKTALEKYLVGFKADQAARQATFETASDAYNTDLSGAYAMRKAQVGSAEARADQATQEALQAWETRNSAQVTQGVQTAKAAQQAYYDATATYRTAEAGQRQAVAKVQSLVQPNGPYGPTVPAKTLYTKLADIAGDAPIPSAPAKQMIVDMTVEMADTGGLMPTAELAKIARTINALPETTDIAHLHELLKELGPLTSVRNGSIRGTASRMMSGVHDTIEAGAKQGGIAEEASDLLYAARASYRQEKALQTVSRILDRRTAGSPITIDAENRLIVNPRTLLLKVEDTIAKEPLFKGSFTPAQLQGLRQDLTDLLQTPAIPKTRPMAPDAAPMPGLAPGQPRPMAPDAAPMPGLAPGQPRPTPVSPDVIRPVTEGPRPTRQPDPPMTPPPDAVPKMSPFWRSGLRSEAMGPALLGMLTGHTTVKAAAWSGVVLGADALEYGLSKALLSPTLRPLVLQSLSASGQLPKSLYGLLGALAAEKAEKGRFPGEGR